MSDMGVLLSDVMNFSTVFFSSCCDIICLIICKLLNTKMKNYIFFFISLNYIIL